MFHNLPSYALDNTCDSHDRVQWHLTWFAEILQSQPKQKKPNQTKTY